MYMCILGEKIWNNDGDLEWIASAFKKGNVGNVSYVTEEIVVDQ